MSTSARRRKARIERRFSIEHPGDVPVPVSPGPCWVESQGSQVALHLGRDPESRVLMMTLDQFAGLVKRHQLALDTW